MKSDSFVTGTIRRHVVKAISLNAINLLFIMCVEVVDVFFLSLLEEQAILAAAGFAGVIFFVISSVGFGISNVVSAETANAYAKTDKNNAIAAALPAGAIGFSIILVSVLILGVYHNNILLALGTDATSAFHASAYLHIIFPMIPIQYISFCSLAVLRALSDNRLAFRASCAGAIANLIFDPIFIFGLELGIKGAAIATGISYLVAMSFAIIYLKTDHKISLFLEYAEFRVKLKTAWHPVIAAVASSLATPIANAFVISSLAVYGQGVMSGVAVVGRLSPFLFSLVYAIPAAIGPIIGQNYGAKNIGRIKKTIEAIGSIIVLYIVLLWIALLFSKDLLIGLFSLSGDGAHVFEIFCYWVVPLTIFLGIMVTATTTLMNIGRHTAASITNISKATVGTVPFVYLGAQFYGVKGVYIFNTLGTGFIGLFALAFVYSAINQTVRQRDCPE